ncbi:MAG: helix-turn-helix transcriptional regulator [Leptospirales bacterium]
MVVTKEVLTRLSKIIDETHLNYEDFAISLGLNLSKITNLLNGKTKTISGNFVKLIEILYGVNPVWLETGMGKKYSKNARPVTAKEILLMENFRLLSEYNQDLICLISETLHKQHLSEQKKAKKKKIK